MSFLAPAFGFWGNAISIAIPSISSTSSDQTTLTAYSSAFTTLPPSADTHYSSQW